MAFKFSIVGLLTMLTTLNGCTFLSSRADLVYGILSLEVYSPVQLGEPVHLKLVVSNPGSRIIRLDGRLTYDFIVTQADGTEVWRWSYRKVIESYLPLPKILGPNEEVEVAAAWWKQTDDVGKPVSPGAYWVQGVLYLGPKKKLETDPRRLIIMPLELRVEIAGEEYLTFWGKVLWRLGQKVPLKLKVKNRSDRPFELAFYSHPPYDFVATRDGTEVWRWSRKQVIRLVHDSKLLLPGEELEFSADWDQHDEKGQLITPDNYVIESVLNLQPFQQLKAKPAVVAIGAGLPLHLELEIPYSVPAGHPVPLKLKVTNVSDHTLDLLIPSPPLDFVVTEPDGTVVWSWMHARGLILPSTLFPFSLQPGETKEYEDKEGWDQRNHESNRVPPGTYWVQGIFRASQSGRVDGILELVLSEPQKLVIKP